MVLGKVFITIADFQSLGDVNIVDASGLPFEPPSVKVPKGLIQHTEKHAKGAIYADLKSVLSGPETEETGSHPLPDPKVFISWIQRAGLDNSRPVVMYDRMGGAQGASRAWWMFDNLGFQAYILEGGFQQYAAAGLPTESGEPAPLSDQPSGRPWKYRTSFRNTVDIDDLGEYLAVDSRPKGRHNSTVRPMHPADKLPGSIPNTKHMDAGSSFTGEQNDALKSVEELFKTICATAGGIATERIAMTCASGISACCNIAVCRHVGLGTPKLHVGSFSQFVKRNREHMQSQILQRHGMLITLEKFVMQSRPATPEDVETVDGNATSDEVQNAIGKLRAGEVARVAFANGNQCRITVRA